MRSHERQIVKKGFKSLTGTEQTGRRRRKPERATGGEEGGGEQGKEEREERGGREAGSSSPLLIFQLVFIVPTLLSARLRCIYFWLVLPLV